MDPRFVNSEILRRRSIEWNIPKVLSYLSELFSNIELIDGWKFLGVNVGKEIKPRYEELKKNVYTNINITFKDSKDRECKYDLNIPDLVSNQFFYIGGFYKIPMFQLIDYPIIYRPEKQNIIKFHNNVLSSNVEYKNNKFNLLIFNRNIPLHDIICCMHTKQEIDEMFNTFNYIDARLQKLKLSCDLIWDSTTQNERLKSIGKLFSTVKNDELKKGNSFIFSLRCAYDVDIFCKKFMKTDSIVKEILNALNEGPRSDTNLENKRIRFAEYVLSPIIKKFYDMLITLKFSNKSNDFKFPQTVIIENCNVSDIVRYNSSINPISEISMLMQCTVTGPGGFKKKIVPSHIREIDESHFGYICPADTPDRDGCGVILNLCPTVDLDDDGRFRNPDKEVVTSYPISLSPFVSNNDQTRLQMASSQMKQSILLNKSEVPMIQTGIESMYLDKSTFLHRAKLDGKVVYKNGDIMIVIYDDGTGDVFKLHYKNGVMDYIQPMFDEGESFNKDDVLCQSKFIKDGELSIGSNLLTGVAIWKGYNYEDGIIISSSVQDKFTSIHSVDLSFEIEPRHVLLSLRDDKYLPLPEIGTTIKKGEVYARLKSIDVDGELENINIESIEKTSPIECTIVSIEMFPNAWNKSIEEHSFNIQKHINSQSKRFIDIKNKISEYINKDQVDKFISMHGLSTLDTQAKEGKYFFDGKRISGVLIKINAIYKEKISVGDKIANRHGNKGVCSKICVVPEKEMPLLPDGRRLEIICNPLGIISRMNPGQLFELNLTECLYQLKLKMKSLPLTEARQLLVKMLELTDKTESKWVTFETLQKFDKNVVKFDLVSAIDNITLYQPAFQSITPDELNSVMTFTGASYKYIVYDPETCSYIQNPISCGYMYFMKLVHRAAEKISYRSIGPYSQKTLQPLGGRSNNGGHRVGEMEVWSLKAYGAEAFLKDLLTVQSDSGGAKNKMLAEALRNPDLVNDDDIDTRPASLKLLDSNLKAIGISMSS